MSGDLADVVTPCVMAAAAAYGGAVLTRVKDELANEAVEFGRRMTRRMTRRILGARAEDDSLPGALADAIDDPREAIDDPREAIDDPGDAVDDPGEAVALRDAIRTAPAGAADLAADVRRLTEEAPAVATFGDRSPAVRTNQGIIATGDGNTFSGTR